MKKGLLLYFSGTGNTKLVGEEICREFEQNDYEFHKRTIDNFQTEKIDIDNYDILLLGFPIYFMYTPFFILDYMKEMLLTSKETKQVIIYSTLGAPIKPDYRELISILKTKNLQVVMVKAFRMPNNYYLEEGYEKYYLDKEKCESLIEKVKKQVKKFVHNYLAGKYKKEMASAFFSGLYKNLAYKNREGNCTKCKDFSVNERCTKCGLCVKQCPTQNISIQNHEITFQNKCVLCTRCINACSQNAILYQGEKKIQYHLNLSSR